MRGEKGGEEKRREGVKGRGGLNPETDRQSFEEEDEEEEGRERGIRESGG